MASGARSNPPGHRALIDKYQGKPRRLGQRRQSALKEAGQEADATGQAVGEFDRQRPFGDNLYRSYIPAHGAS
jgi:hypothetical protein